MSGYKNIQNDPKAGTKSFKQNPENINKEGRKKKIYTVLKAKGFGADDIRTAFAEMAFYTLKELQEVHNDDSKPIITRIVANQYWQAMKKGDWGKVREILEHVIGKAPAIIGLVGDEDQVKQIFKIGDQEIEF